MASIKSPVPVRPASGSLLSPEQEEQLGEFIARPVTAYEDCPEREESRIHQERD